MSPIHVAEMHQEQRHTKQHCQRGGDNPQCTSRTFRLSADPTICFGHTVAHRGVRASDEVDARQDGQHSNMALIQFRRHFGKGGYDGIDGHRDETPTGPAELHG
jgi:hypothetical protein